VNADAMFVIGATHAVCQDYVVAGNNSPYVVLSDGCSSSPGTDIGARLMVKAAESALRSERSVIKLHHTAARVALGWARAIGLTVQAVDATLLTLHFLDGELSAGCSGDGVVVLETPDRGLDVYSISYPSGYPIYPTYLYQPERLDALVAYGVTREVRHYISDSNDEELRLVDTLVSDSLTEVFTLRATDYKYAALVSDGLHSFFHKQKTPTSKNIESIAMTQVVRELLCFKSIAGAFVARRLKSFMKDCQKRGWEHADDLSIGVVHLGAQASRLPT
jgi:Protein phosphatase 2C